MIECYRTLSAPARGVITVKGSRFIGTIAPVASREEALEFITRISNEFADATHNAYAYRIGVGEEKIAYCGDDREPAGSAGPPMLQALAAADLDYVAAVGTRYFGGIKLGIGGLIRAYRGCLEAALEAAEVVQHQLTCPFQIVAPYDCIGAVFGALGAAGGQVTGTVYEKDVCIYCTVPLAAASHFAGRIRDATRGKGRVTKLMLS